MFGVDVFLVFRVDDVFRHFGTEDAVDVFSGVPEAVGTAFLPAKVFAKSSGVRLITKLIRQFARASFGKPFALVELPKNVLEFFPVIHILVI